MARRARMLLLCGFAAALSLSAAPTARAAVIIDQVGIEAVGGVGIPLTLTGGFLNNTDHSWTHTGYGVIVDPIVFATLRIDIIDGDDGFLDMYAGTTTSDPLIGSATGGDQGLPGPWRDLQSPPGPNPGDGAYDNLIVIDPSLYADIADGTFQVFGDNRAASLTAWGSNRVILTITTTIPEPSTALLLGAGLVAVALRRRRR